MSPLLLSESKKRPVAKEQGNIVDMTLDESKLPKGSKVLRYPRADRGFFQSCYDTFISFVMWHYLVWGFWAGMACGIGWYWLGIPTAVWVALGVVYFAQLVLYQVETSHAPVFVRGLTQPIVFGVT